MKNLSKTQSFNDPLDAFAARCGHERVSRSRSVECQPPQLHQDGGRDGRRSGARLHAVAEARNAVGQRQGNGEGQERRRRSQRLCPDSSRWNHPALFEESGSRSGHQERPADDHCRGAGCSLVQGDRRKRADRWQALRRPVRGRIALDAVQFRADADRRRHRPGDVDRRGGQAVEGSGVGTHHGRRDGDACRLRQEGELCGTRGSGGQDAGSGPEDASVQGQEGLEAARHPV